MTRPVPLGRLLACASCAFLTALHATGNPLSDVAAPVDDRLEVIDRVTRRALLVWLPRYPSDEAATLPDDREEADAVARRLAGLGFDVTTRQHGERTRVVLHEELRSFLGSSKPGELSLLYFSGHVVQADGRLFLVPPTDRLYTSDARGDAGLIAVSAILKDFEATPSAAGVLFVDVVSGAPPPPMDSDRLELTAAPVALAPTSGKLNVVLGAANVPTLVRKNAAEEEALVDVLETGLEVAPAAARLAAALAAFEPRIGEELRTSLARLRDSIVRSPPAPRAAQVQLGAHDDVFLLPVGRFVPHAACARAFTATNSTGAIPGTPRSHPLEGDRSTVPLTLRWVPPGEVQTECTRGEKTCVPGARVSVASGFFMSEAEITERQYGACVAAGYCASIGDQPCAEEGTAPGAANRARFVANPDQPVACVSWYDARDFCEWIGGRLPSLDEWRYVVTSGVGLAYPWGTDAPTPEKAHLRYSDNEEERDVLVTARSRPGGRSCWGFWGLVGNASEWTTLVARVMNENRASEHVAAVGGSSATPADGRFAAVFDREARRTSLGFRCVLP